MSAVDWLMSKCALFAVAGVLGLCISLSAQEIRDSGSIQAGNFTLNPLTQGGASSTRSALGQTGFFGTLGGAWNGPLPLTLADGSIFSFPGAFAWMAAPPVDFLPAAALAQPARVSPAASSARDSGNETVSLLPKFDYAGGEVGAFYGKSSGRFGREVEGGYIIGEVVDGNTHISVGASYQHSSGRVPNVFGR